MSDATIQTDFFSDLVQGVQAQAASGRVVDIIEFFENPYYLGKRCNPRRFANQKIILKAFNALPLTDADLEFLERMADDKRTNWTPDGGPYSVLILYVGQRGGKSWLGSGIAWHQGHVWLEHENPHVTVLKERGREWIAEGSPVEIKLVATSEDNAKDHIFKEARAFGEVSPYLREKIGDLRNITSLRIKLPKNLTMIAGSSTAKAIRGGTGLAGIGDEFPWMIDTEGHKGGEEVYQALQNTLSTTGGPLIAIGSPASVDDILYREGQKAMAGELSNVLFFNLPTWIFDPSQKPSDYDHVKARDFERWERDFLAKPSQALEPYFKQGHLVKKFFSLQVPGDFEAPGVGANIDLERDFHQLMREFILSDEYPFHGRFDYTLSGDPAEKNDAFGYALSHITSSNKVIFDLIGRFIPDKKKGREIDSLEVRHFMTQVADKFEVVDYVDDGYSFPEMRQSLKDHGCNVIEQILDTKKASIAKEAIYLGDAECWMLPQAFDEIMSIELKNAKKLEFRRTSGRPGHGDIACAILQNISVCWDPTQRSDDYEFILG